MSVQGMFIAHVPNNQLTFGPETYEKVIEWAKNKLQQNPKIEKILVGEFSCTVHRPTQVMVTPYVPAKADPIAT